MRVCPDCGARAVEFIPEASGDVCTECGHTVDLVLLDGSKDIAEGNGLSLWQDGMATVLKPLTTTHSASHSGSGAGWVGQSRDKQNSKLMRDQDQLRDTRRFIKGTLAHLSRARYADRAFGLFDVVRRAALERTHQVEAFWKKHEDLAPIASGSNLTSPTRKRNRRTTKLIGWGLKSKALALACIYATITTAEPTTTISLQQVIHSSGEEGHASTRALSFHKVAKRLRLVRAFGGPAFAHIREDAPRFYIDAAMDFFEALIARQQPLRRPSIKGKERDMGSSAGSSAPSNTPLVSDELKHFLLRHVSIPRARTLAHQLALTLEDADYPPPPGPTLTTDRRADPHRARESTMHMHLTAYAIALWAIEASGRTPGPQAALIALSRYARRGQRGVDELTKARERERSKRSDGALEVEAEDENEESEEEEDEEEGAGESVTNSKTTLQLRYSDIRNILSDASKHIPWVLSASILASGRRRRPPAPAANATTANGFKLTNKGKARELSRLDVIRWMADILAFRETALRRKKEHDDALKSRRGERPNSPTEPESDNVSRSAAGPPELAVKKDPPITTTNGATRRRPNSSDPPPDDDTDLPLPTLEDSGLYPDEILFDSDEDLGTTYLRSTPERVVVEAVLRENGSWELHERREREREEGEKVQREREEGKRSKVLRVPWSSGTAGGEKRKRKRKEMRMEEEGEEGSEEEDDGDDEPSSRFDPAWMKPVDFSTQTEGWSDSSAEEPGDEHASDAEQEGLDDDDGDEDEGEEDDVCWLCNN
ncbi:hypothetical protein V8E36_005339 [Tilletia maclaganii]